MRLSQIKLSGFKSFPDSVAIPVQGDIVAVVGPNGCGKSNLIDAVRWVLGESSAKQLRGENMQDVIFNGTNYRKMVSRTSVELVFNNSQGYLKGPWGQYTEISVKRILTRQGDSSYWINSQQVRKKDITDLFLGTGLGARGYAVIEQGMISKIIEAKPEELRAYIDEAAGISKYKERRKETENRLKSTQESLNRISDLKQEIAGQQQKLSKQANKAKKYVAIKNELHKIQNILVATQLKICLEKIEVFESKKNTSQQELIELEKILENHKEDNYQLQLQEYIVQEELDVYRQQYSKLNESLVSLETELKFQEKEHLRQQNEKNKIQTELQKLKESVQNNREIKIQLEASLEEKELIFKNTNDDLQELYEQSQNSEGEFEQKETLFNTVKSAIHLNEHTLQVREEELHRLNQELVNLNEQLQVRRIRISEQQIIDVSEQELLSDTLDDLLKQTIKHIDRLSQEQAMLKSKISQMTDEIRQNDNKLIALEVEIKLFSERLKNIEARHNSFWKQFPELYLPPLWESLTIYEHWQQALSVYLGERLFARLSDTLPSYPSDTHNSAVWVNRLPSLEYTTVVEDSIMQYIECDANLQALMNYWLGQVRCIDSLDKALQKQTTLQEGEIFLTPEGIIVDKYGIYLEGENQEDSVLNLQNNILQLNQEQLALENSSQQYQTQLSELKQREKKLDDEIHSAVLQKNDIQTQLNNSKQVIAESKAKNELQTKFLADTRLEMERLEFQVLDLNTRQQKLVADIERINVSLGQDQDRFANIESDYLSSKQGAKDYQQQLLDGERAKSQLELELIDLKNRIHNHKNDLIRAEEKIQILRQEDVLNAENLTLDMTVYQNKIAKFAQSCREKADLIQLQEEKVHSLRERKKEINLCLEQVETQKKVIEKDIHAFELEIQQEIIYKNQYIEMLQDRQQNISELIALNAQNDYNVKELSDNVSALTAKLKSLGTVNLNALDELKEVEERHKFYHEQYSDIVTSVGILQSAIKKIDAETQVLFKETLEKVNQHIAEFFPKLLGGGEAYLSLTSDNLLDTGLRLMGRPLGKKNTTIHLLSGGEKALTALSLVFALFNLNPAPFCLLDEVDAPLDDANIIRFTQLVREMSKTVQFLFISHNQLTMEIAEQLIGVTMQEKGVSRIVSVDINDALTIGQ